VEVIYPAATMGACIECADLTFFIAAGLGKQTIDSKQIIFLSPQAPLARLLQHKKAGESFIFNGKDTVIETVY